MARQEQVEPGKTEPLPVVAEAPVVAQERVAPTRIAPADAGPDAAQGASPEADVATPAGSVKDRGRWWRGLTGSMAAGLVVLAVGVLVVGVICLFTGAPGPGAASLIGHPLAAVLALVAQRVADRRSGLPAAGGGAAVVLFAVSAATIFWLT
ncbi:hypothetical protein [Amycolatopsis sp. lyj-346]|uniref:hypothetical protein n=1 Tax=Amycolatopsis sp. lyj-346 TaxID=2789289 RepID=UPI0039795539